MPVKALRVPFFSHLDETSGYKSSVLASVGMCLSFYGMPSKILAADLLQRSNNRLWFPLTIFNLKSLIDSYLICRDTPTVGGTLKDLRLAIDEQQPCILHGFFDRFGHVIVVKGYTSYGLIVNDAAGEWSKQGYRIDLNGEGAIYTYDQISQLCSPESAANPRHLCFHRVAKV